MIYTQIMLKKYFQGQIKTLITPDYFMWQYECLITYIATTISNLKIKIYGTIILSVVLYGCETWSLTLREERRLRVFANRVLRRIFGSGMVEVTGK